VPGYLWPFAALPWLLLLLALGGFVWGLVAGLTAAALSGLGVALVQARRTSVGARLACLLVLDGVAGMLLIVVGALLVVLSAGPERGPGPAIAPNQPVLAGQPGAGQPAPALPPAPDVPLPPVRKLFTRGPRVYLADQEEFGVRSGPWPFGKDGKVGDGRPIRVAGVRSRKGLSMHPPDAPGFASARYRLGKQAAVFKAVVAINETSNWCFSPATFTVLGDGRPLWQSAAIAHNHTHSQECRVDVTGVDVLELRVQVANGSTGVHAVWVEPRLLQKADTPDEAAPLFAAGPRLYLSDVDPFEVHPGPWPVSPGGVIGPDNNPITVAGVRSPKGLGMHPPDGPGAASARYRLGKKAAVFKAAVALNDTAQIVVSRAVFEVYGDGKLLWQSAAVGKGTPPQECRVDVSGVDVLELRVTSEGSHIGLHAVWVEPRLLQKADTPDR
jgi:hypothetical protein